MKINLKYLLIPIALYLLQGCCWTDHSEEIKKVAVPMQQELEKFYKENKHFPTTQERDEMLERIGCRVDVSGNTCVYERERLKIISYESSYDYTVDFGIENTYCVLFMYKKTKRNTLNCNNNPCISLKQ